MTDTDIVADILERACAIVRNEISARQLDTLTAERLIEHILGLETPVRRHWRGRVPQRDPAKVEAAKAAALAEVQRTGRVAEASSRHGVSRATIYRLLAER